MTTISQCGSPLEAHLLRMRLEAVGISAAVEDELAAGWNPLWTNALGGVRVRVADADVAAALEFIRADKAAAEEAVRLAPPVCPRCQSVHTKPDNRRARWGALILLLQSWALLLAPAVLSLPRSGWRCSNCKHVFETDHDHDPATPGS